MLVRTVTLYLSSFVGVGKLQMLCGSAYCLFPRALQLFYTLCSRRSVLFLGVCFLSLL